VYKTFQAGEDEYDPAGMLGQWLDSAKDVPISKVYNPFTNRTKPMIPKSARYTGQMYVGDDEACASSRRFVVPAACSQARFMALGLPFCASTNNYYTLSTPRDRN